MIRDSLVCLWDTYSATRAKSDTNCLVVEAQLVNLKLLLRPLDVHTESEKLDLFEIWSGHLRNLSRSAESHTPNQNYADVELGYRATW